MSRTRILIVLIATVVAAGVITLARHLGGNAEREAAMDLYAQLGDVRAAVDSCRSELTRNERRFHAFDRRVDSLRIAVRALESGAGRVPADSYAAYLRRFEQYNAAVPLWRARADSLRDDWSACRDRVANHNVLADSLRALTENLDRDR